MKKLSPRLHELTKWFLHDHTLIDIGCDHGWLPIWALHNGCVPSAIAVDRALEPVKLASKNGKEVDGLQVVLSDGLDDVEVPMGAVLSIAGMGGRQMCSILKRAPLYRITRVILQPNRDAHLVRDWLASVGWYTQQASVVEDKRRFFLSWCAESGKGEIGKNRWHWEESWFGLHPSPIWKKWRKMRFVQIQRTEAKHGLSASLKEEKDALSLLWSQ